MKRNEPMTELKIEREGYRFMVSMFSIALFVVIIFGGLYCANLNEKIKTANPVGSYQLGWNQGYLRAIQATNDAVLRGDTIALSEFEKALEIDLAEFKQKNGLK